MPSLMLFVGSRPDCAKVRDLAKSPKDVDCASLASCASLCLLRGDSERVARDGANFVVLGSGESELEFGRHGAVCWSHQSAGVVDTAVSNDATFECIVTNIEGVLDDGLALGKDFWLIGALPYRELADLDRAFLVSANLNLDGFWCFVIRMQRDAALRLLQSATMGYLLGVRISGLDGGTTARLIRCAGYDDAETDLLVSDGLIWQANNILATF